MGLIERTKKAWLAFFNKDPTDTYQHIDYKEIGRGTYLRPDKVIVNSKSIIVSIFNRISVDASSIAIRHVKIDDQERYVETINSSLNNCLNLEANIDQTGRAFLQDLVLSMLDEGCVCIAPIIFENRLDYDNETDISNIRVCKILEWFPQHVKIHAYDERDGVYKDIVIPKRSCAIIENPLYSVINEQNSTLKRLTRKLSLLDLTDEKTASGKMNILIRLPYAIKTSLKRQQVERRREELEKEMVKSKYGIGFLDSTEQVVQLNRPLDNNLLQQIPVLTEQLYSELGITMEILNGTADEKTMLNYYSRTIEPIVSAISDEIKRKFLSLEARERGETIMFFRDPFRLVPVSDVAEIADKFTRNEVLTSNEVRQIVGMRPSSDPNADKLRNKNLNPSEYAKLDNQVKEVGKEINQNGKTDEV